MLTAWIFAVSGLRWPDLVLYIIHTMANFNRSLSLFSSMLSSSTCNTNISRPNPLPSSEILAPLSSPPIPLQYSDEEEDSNENEDQSSGEGGGKSSDEDEGEGFNTPRPVDPNRRQVVGQNSSAAEKTKAIMKQLKRLQLSFGTFVEEAVKLCRYKSQLTCTPNLTRSLYTRAQVVEMFEEAAYAEYRAELKSMSKYNHFRS